MSSDNSKNRVESGKPEFTFSFQRPCVLPPKLMQKIHLLPRKTPYLLFVINDMSQSAPDGWCQASNQQLADIVKCSPERISRMVSRLRKLKLIKVRMTRGGTVRRMKTGWPVADPSNIEPPENPIWADEMF